MAGLIVSVCVCVSVCVGGDFFNRYFVRLYIFIF